MAAGPASPRLPADAVERRLFVNAPPETVWRALHGATADAAVSGPGSGPARYALLSLDACVPPWPAAGSQRHGRLRLGPVRLSLEVESLEARPARRFRLALAGPIVHGEARWEFVGASGGTRVACALHLVGESRLGRTLLRFERGALGRRLETELAALKRAAEADAGPDAGPAAR